MKVDGKVGVWNGKTVCYCDPNDYFMRKSEYDARDHILVMADTNYMVHHGLVIGKLVDGNRVDLWNMTSPVEKYYHKLKASDVNTNTNKTKVPVKVEVTKRHTVEWYMQHTIEILNNGVKYGEERLRELAERRTK